jgi:hypothetical protein
LTGAIEDNPKSEASVADRQNALDRCYQIIELRGRGNPAELLGNTAKRAGALVIASRVTIEALAHRLAELGEMNGAEIDAVLEG